MITLGRHVQRPHRPTFLGKYDSSPSPLRVTEIAPPHAPRNETSPGFASEPSDRPEVRTKT
ncbi:hypothetical protein GCM10010245_51950 [Streptomyces spectabilis]|nr:hypothetical protein GCM10010245_51950 [Streptomyces spectabilis]